ncbi:hypothetical protein Leryth_010254 [Lithospermum erythrorhizon]|nr:hypothetical protein Leryth_010254 [Lithospermum erythrorhizon]
MSSKTPPLQFPKCPTATSSPPPQTTSSPPLSDHFKLKMQIYSPNLLNQSTPLLPYTQLSTRHNHRRWKRRRVKSIPPPHQQFRCNFSSSAFESVFNNFISQIPSLHTNSLLNLAPVIGLASGIAIYLSNPRKLISNNNNSIENNNSVENNIGEWILFTTPTPFNRFVILRCPSIRIEGGEFLEDLNERLVKEDKHFVRLNSGRIEVKKSDEIKNLDENLLVYQRICVGTEDGGVISIDWPESLGLEEERGLDTTVMIVPGTSEGSGEGCIREFVVECLRRGCFPLVMNPRGCAGSPLTSPRLFSAADSDDVSTAIDYIKRERPWSTMVAVGWGYGANMLTKYLAEVGEQTPLTAATCINNPFDLDEATRCSPHHIAYDKILTKGLIEILQSNKELFQGKTKRFDVPKALSSTSIRDFEKAISMVSYGINALEEFYAKSSTVYAVRDVKIPTLFIQNDDGSVPVFSVPRHLIAENPFTSLLLCSSLPSNKLFTAKLTMSWCQHLAIEWLTAVELGLLKGRHPLVMDVDVTINPSKGFELVDEHVSGIKSGRGTKLVKFLASNASDEHSLDSTGTIIEKGDPLANVYPTSSPKGNSQIQNNQSNKENGSRVHKASSIDAVVVDEGVDSAEGEKGEVLQTAQVVMNMLDVTMPDTLKDEQKQKVLAAVGQGESLMKALQDAVPEDVREKLTSSVSGILKNKSSNIKLDELFHMQGIPNKASGLRSNVEEKDKALHAEGEKDESNSSQMRRSDDSLVVSQPTIGNHDLGDQASTDLEKSTNTEHLNRSNGSETSTSEKDTGGVEDADRGMNNTEKYIEPPANVDSGPEAVSKTESSPQSEGAGGTRNSIEKDKTGLDDDKSEQDMRESNSDPEHEKNIADSSIDKEKTSVTTHVEGKEIAPALSSEKQLMNDESSENHKKDVDNIQPSQNQNTSSSPGFNVSQALDALTGIDDSTQVAVNTVYNVIEDLITQLEDERENKTEAKDEKIGEDGNTVSSSGEHLEHNNNKIEETSKHPDVADDLSPYNKSVSGEESIRDPVIIDKCRDDTLQEVASENYLDKDDGKVNPSTYLKPTEKSAMYMNSTLNGSSLPVSVCETPLYKDSNIISKMDGSKPLGLESTSALFLENPQEEGQRKLFKKMAYESRKDECNDIIEPSYIILDAREHEPDEQLEVDEPHGISYKGNMSSVRAIIKDAMEMEVGRKLNATYMQEMKSELSGDIEHVVNAVCLALKDEESLPNVNVLDGSSERSVILQGEHVSRAISSALLETVLLRKTLPVGVVVGSCLAALMKYPNVEVIDCSAETQENSMSQSKSGKVNETDSVVLDEVAPNGDLDEMDTKNESKVDTNSSANNAAMVGAMSAALGASALLVGQQGHESNEVSSQPLEENGNARSLVTTLAEKAMSVAGPVVPTKDGEVDQDKLVAMMAELGQKGGILRLFGKVALLYGGMRGAISLTDKLISFLHMAERPLYQRVMLFI